MHGLVPDAQSVHCRSQYIKLSLLGRACPIPYDHKFVYKTVLFFCDDMRLVNLLANPSMFLLDEKHESVLDYELTLMNTDVIHL
ncbi:hypothetical protein BFX79_00280 [Neisseria meningitidis]|nr:hypothetical protein BFX79_00280 [Neisseria meningitidis]ODP42724.1 hypothetical protein BFX78_00280 [Neisseria meningitidis]